MRKGGRREEKEKREERREKREERREKRRILVESLTLDAHTVR